MIFSPDVPIRLYYQAKKVEFQTYGPIQGLIMGLASLNCSELRLKRISYRHGLLGFDKLITFLAREWINDIKKNQIPNLLVGVGPIYSFVQICKHEKLLVVLVFLFFTRKRLFQFKELGIYSFCPSSNTRRTGDFSGVFIVVLIVLPHPQPWQLWSWPRGFSSWFR